MSEEYRLRERLSLALRHAMPEWADPDRWRGEVAKRTGIPERRVKCHWNKEHKVAAVDIFAYFDHFGDDFAAFVRGPKS